MRVLQGTVSSTIVCTAASETLNADAENIMFEPGHVHRTHEPLSEGDIGYSIDFHYDVRDDATKGRMLQGRLEGEIDGKPFKDSFELHQDTAFNFASVITRLLTQHGLHPDAGMIMHDHKEYDEVFEDIRAKLGSKPGDSVDLQHLEEDGF